MAYKVSDIDKYLHRKVTKITGEQKRRLLNTEVKEDIIETLIHNYPDQMIGKSIITIIDGTTEYDLPSDFGERIKITDGDGNDLLVRSAYSDETEDYVYFTVISGVKKINVRSGTKIKSIRIEYEKIIADVDQDTEDIPYPEFMVDRSFLRFLAMMVSYYYLLEKKKYDEAGVLLNTANQFREKIFDNSSVITF